MMGTKNEEKKSVVKIIIFSRKVSIDKRDEHISYICFGILFSELNVCAREKETKIKCALSSGACSHN